MNRNRMKISSITLYKAAKADPSLNLLKLYGQMSIKKASKV